MGPLPLLCLAWLLGLLFSPRVPAWALALSVLAAATLAWRVADRRLWIAALLCLVAAFAAGALRQRVFAPSTWESIPETTALRVRGRVVLGCLDVGDRQRCELDTVTHGRAVLRVPLGRCPAVPGDVIEAVATARAWVPLRNPPLETADTRWMLRGVGFQLDAAACERVGRDASLRDRVRALALRTRRALDRALHDALTPEAAGWIAALLFGDTRAMDDVTVTSFRDSGLAHLLAVSGAHVSLLLGALGWAVRAVAVRVPWIAARGQVRAWETVLPLPCAGFFILVTGESPASMRALWAGLLTALATLSGRRADAESVLAAVTFGMSLVDPTLTHDLGWALSVIASWALCQRRPDDAPSVKQAFARAVLAELLDGLWSSLRVGAAVTPLLAWSSGRAPLGALAMNVVAAPLGEVLGLPLSLLTGALAMVAPTCVARVVGTLTAHVLDALMALPEIALRIPWASVAWPVPTMGEWVVATVALVAAWRCTPRGAAGVLATAALVVCALELSHRAGVHPTGVLRVTALDVGQGDAVVIDLPDGTAMLVDAGGALHGEAFDPGERVVARWLSLQRRRLVATVLSHPHPDHGGGMAAVLAAVPTDALWDTGQGEHLHTGGFYAALRDTARRRSIRVVGPEVLCGGPRAFHGATLEVLAPCPGVIDAVPANDASWVIRLTYGRASVLLPGDLERGGEATLRARWAPTTVLKVGHHGSRTSSSEAFLDAVRPSVALVSCGHPSPFGHPHPEVVARYARRGIPLRRTDLAGAVSVTLHPDGRWE